MENEIIDVAKENLLNGTVDFLISKVNWVFAGFGVIVAWIFDEYNENSKTTTLIPFSKKIPRGVRMFLFGLILAFVYSFFFMQDASRLEYGKLLMGILAFMGIHILREGVESIIKK